MAENGLLSGMLLAHVDDLLFAGTTSFIAVVLQALKAFRTGDIETISIREPITFAGLTIENPNQRPRCYPNNTTSRNCR